MNSKTSIILLSYFVCVTLTASSQKNDVPTQNELRVLFNFTSEEDFTEDDVINWNEQSDTIR